MDNDDIKAFKVKVNIHYKQIISEEVISLLSLSFLGSEIKKAIMEKKDSVYIGHVFIYKEKDLKRLQNEAAEMELLFNLKIRCHGLDRLLSLSFHVDDVTCH